MLSAPYARDGFCVSNQDKSVYYQSHALCFYTDTAFCIILSILFKMAEGTASEKAIAPIKKNIPGHFFHGAVHMYIAFEEVTKNTAFEDVKVPLDTVKGLILGSLFWFFLLKGVMSQKRTSSSIAVITVPIVLFSFFLLP